MRGYALGLVLSFLVLQAARAEEIVETYEDGAVKARYSVDDQGRKSGSYVAYWANGRVARRAFYAKDAIEGSEQTFDEGGKRLTQALYRHGLLHGRFLTWDGDGKPAVVAKYANGKLDGTRELFRAGKQVSTQVWHDGELRTLDGVNTFPRSQEEIRRTLSGILAGAAAGGKGAEADAQAAGDRVVALRRLRAYRYLCGLPYADLVLGEDQCRHAEAAALVCSKLGHLTHDPPNPGMPEAEYKVGAVGARNCNLGQGTAAASVDGYMDDSDPTNIDRLGHRRWCLNPPMRITGFGTAMGAENTMYTAMWATDATGTVAGDTDAVCYPPAGWVPVDFFASGYAWSVSFPRERVSHAAAADLRVAVYELDSEYVRAAAPLETDYFRVSDEPYGMPLCVIFRPKAVRTEPGVAYWVEVSGVDPKSRKTSGAFRYVVQFAPAVTGIPEAMPAPEDAPDR